MPGCSTAKNPQGIEITFTEDDHKYRSIIDGNEISYISGTGFLHNFFRPFDPDGKITEQCAKKEGLTVEAIKAKWAEKGKKSCIFGTRVHETCEDVFNSSLTFRNTPIDEKETLTFENAKKVSLKIKMQTDILGVEKIVFSHKLGIAGTIDLFAQSKKDGSYLIIDHKTNESIDVENKYNNWGLDPISHIPDINFYHYALQLNLYEYLLKYGKYVPYDAKFKLFINHITTNGYKLMKLPNLQLEIRDMIISYLLKKNQ